MIRVTPNGASQNCWKDNFFATIVSNTWANFQVLFKKYGIWWISTISQLQRTYFYFKLKFPNITRVACFNRKLFDRNDNINSRVGEQKKNQLWGKHLEK